MTTHAPATYTSGCIRGRLSGQEVLESSAKQSHPNRHLPLSELQTADAEFNVLCSSLARHCDDRDRTLELALHLVR